MFSRLVACLSAALIALLVPSTAWAYVHPVEGTVIDPFRAPSNPYGPGNRGIEYSVAPGSPVRASADGRVTFAGQVGGDLFVVIDHADGIRTTYGGLAALAVAVGTELQANDVVGDAGPRFHFGARRGGQYIDPAGLFGRVHLVALESAPPYGVDQPTTTPANGNSAIWLSDSLASPTSERPLSPKTVASASVDPKSVAPGRAKPPQLATALGGGLTALGTLSTLALTRRRSRAG